MIQVDLKEGKKKKRKGERDRRSRNGGYKWKVSLSVVIIVNWSCGVSGSSECGGGNKLEGMARR